MSNELIPGSAPLGSTPNEPKRLVVVDFGKKQSKRKIDKLLEGKGALVLEVEKLVEDLVKEGTITDAVPVVIVIREKITGGGRLFWPFDNS
jgi:hypothetical protein